MSLSEEGELESMIRSSVKDLMDHYEEDYWREIRESRDFPWEVWNDLGENDWLGVTIPEEYGGQGMGIQELLHVVETVGTNGGWTLPIAFMFTTLFGGEAILKHGTDEQRETWLPQFATGDALLAIGVTEPEAGINTTNIDTLAERDGEEYVINGRKIWCSRVGEADRILLLTRTLERDEVDNPAYGLSVFLVDPEDPNVEYEEIPLDGYMEETYNVYLDDVSVHASQMIGEEHRGLYDVFDVLNSERIVVSAACYAIGQSAIEMAAEYANQREVFDQPIGAHQGIQHPLADAYADLECANRMTHEAAELYDQDAPSDDVGSIANIAKLKSAEAGFNACEAAMTTFGGMSISSEIGLSKMWSYVRHLRIGPVTEQMCLNHIAENQLGLPRSY
jgi:acyl-CoA dehydrogenase